MNTKTALVTGGSTGIGKSICQHLLADGYTVLNLSRRELNEDNEHLINCSVDLSDTKATSDAIAVLANKYDINTPRVVPALLGI